jgi:hypothetical protein
MSRRVAGRRTFDTTRRPLSRVEIVAAVSNNLAMTWDEIQTLQLEVAREVGAAYGLRAEIAEPEDPNTSAFEATPVAVVKRWSIFGRRPQFRELRVAFYRQDEPYGSVGNWVNLNEIDKLAPSAYQRGLETSIREGVEMLIQHNQNR